MIHKTAIVEEGAKIGHNVTIAEYAIIRKNVTIGNGVYIGTHSIIGDKGGFKKRKGQEPIGEVIVDYNAVIKSHVVIKSPEGEGGITFIGAYALIMDFVNIGHDTKVHAECVVSTGARIAGECYILRDTTIGMNVLIHQKSVIGRSSMIGMGAIVKGEIPPNSKVIGINKIIGSNDK